VLKGLDRRILNQHVPLHHFNVIAHRVESEAMRRGQAYVDGNEDEDRTSECHDKGGNEGPEG